MKRRKIQADPPDVWGEAEDRELNWISVAKWKARHDIEEDVQSIYLYAIWGKRQWRWISNWPETEKKNLPGRLILFLDFSRLYYYHKVSIELGEGAGLAFDGSECCREIGPDSDLIHVRAKWKDYLAERSLFFSIFYRIQDERHVELVKAGWRQRPLKAPEWSEDMKDFVLEKRQKRIWKKEMYICLDNTEGHGTVKITGPSGKKMVDSGVACGIVVPLEEME